MTITPMCNDDTLIADLKAKNRLNPNVTYKLTCSNSENYRVGELVGEGGFNNVYTLFHSTKNRIPEITEIPDRVIRISKTPDKNINTDELTGLFIQSVLSKPDKEGGLGCDYICKVHEFGYLKDESDTNNDRVYAIIEKLEYSNLVSVFNPTNNSIQRANSDSSLSITSEEANLPPVAKDFVTNVFIQILHGLECLSKNRYVHLDIKEQNIGIDYAGNAKIIDFGFARYMSDKELQNEQAEIVGTDGLIDPNYKNNRIISMNSDIYAVGVMLHSFTHTMLDKDGKITYIKNEESAYKVYNNDPEYNDLKNRMMNTDPAKRLTASQALQHKWFASAYCYRKYRGTTCEDSTDIQKNIAHYLSHFSDRDMHYRIKYSIIYKSFGSTKCDYFKTVYDDIVIALGKLDPQLLGGLSKGEWEKCQGDCFKILTKYVNKEVESTAYMMRLFEASKLGWDNDIKLNYIFHCHDITGTWENDKDKLDIVAVAMSGALKPKKPRLIMGFGPSASGKTYCASEVIKLMQQVEGPTFPDLFLSIDGGIYRECSVVYQLILQALKQVNDKIPGLKNLVFAGFHITSSIFDSSKIKKRVMNYLKEQKVKKEEEEVKKDYRPTFSLYVPETLGKCISLRKEFSYNTTCSSEYKDYITYTGDNDNWIGLMIWQHKTGAECTFDEEYKCKGCTESGESRETMEGKQYSSGAWDKSYKYGLLAAKDAPTYRFIIHNTGGRKHSVEGKEKFNTITFEDYSNYSEETAKRVQSAVDDLKWKYVNKMQETSLSEPPVESNASEQEIQKNIENAKQILVAINKIMTKAIKEKLKSGGVDTQAIQYGGVDEPGAPTVADPDETLYNTIIQQIQNELPTFGVYSVNFFTKTLVPLLNENIKNNILTKIKSYDTDAKQKYIVEQINEYIKDIYLPSQKTMLTEHQLISMSMDILAKLSEKTDKTDKTEDNGIKQLLKIAFEIAFPEKSYAATNYEVNILPKSSVRIIGMDEKLVHHAPSYTDEDGSEVSEQNNNTESTINVVSWKKQTIPQKYEMHFPVNVAGDDLTGVIDSIQGMTTKIKDADPKFS